MGDGGSGSDKGSRRDKNSDRRWQQSVKPSGHQARDVLDSELENGGRRGTK